MKPWLHFVAPLKYEIYIFSNGSTLYVRGYANSSNMDLYYIYIPRMKPWLHFVAPLKYEIYYI